MSEIACRRRVIVTEAEGPGRSLAASLADAGIDVRMVAVVAHTPPPDQTPLDDAIDRLGSFDWIAFTSVRAVDAVAARPAWPGLLWTDGRRPRVAAVGPITRARLEAAGVPVAVCPDTPGAQSLADALAAAGGAALAGASILWPRSDIARPDLADALRAAGAIVVAPVAYCTVPVVPPEIGEVVAELEAGQIDGVAFLSPSGVAGLAAALPGGTLARLAQRTMVASVGPTTSSALVQHGASPTLESPSRTAGGLATALLSYFGVNDTRPL